MCIGRSWAGWWKSLPIERRWCLGVLVVRNSGLAAFRLPLCGVGGVCGDVLVEAEEVFRAEAGEGHQDKQCQSNVGRAGCQEPWARCCCPERERESRDDHREDGRE